MRREFKVLTFEKNVSMLEWHIVIIEMIEHPSWLARLLLNKKTRIAQFKVNSFPIHENWEGVRTKLPCYKIGDWNLGRQLTRVAATHMKKLYGELPAPLTPNDEWAEVMVDSGLSGSSNLPKATIVRDRS